MFEQLLDNFLGDPDDIDVDDDLQPATPLEDANEDDENLAENGDNDNANDNGNENADQPADVKKKRIIKNPQPKLDAERLKGPRGIKVLEDVFKDFKFHGKGHEKTDLNHVMKRLEHWAYRLYPKLQFDDCLVKIENLGHKRPIMTYVKKIRLGMETGDDDPVRLSDDDALGDDVTPAVNDETPAIDPFDELIGQQIAQYQSHPTTPVAKAVAQQPLTLTAEQIEVMERNRQIAAERRRARLKAQEEMEKNISSGPSQVEEEFSNIMSRMCPSQVAEESFELNTNVNTATRAACNEETDGVGCLSPGKSINIDLTEEPTEKLIIIEDGGSEEDNSHVTVNLITEENNDTVHILEEESNHRNSTINGERLPFGGDLVEEADYTQIALVGAEESVTGVESNGNLEPNVELCEAANVSNDDGTVLNSGQGQSVSANQSQKQLDFSLSDAQVNDDVLLHQVEKHITATQDNMTIEKINVLPASQTSETDQQTRMIGAVADSTDMEDGDSIMNGCAAENQTQTDLVIERQQKADDSCHMETDDTLLG